ncbi:MAG TPA: serine--tRNA ligase [Candidatus Wolfebacteria bacterium]|nr:serine--tRNA ligase [Candidatus Wolfebacteria bacterium]
MLDINFIRNNPEEVKKGIAAKNVSPNFVDEFLVLDKEWRELTSKLDNLRAEHKILSQTYADRGADKRGQEAEAAKENKEKIKEIESKLNETEKRREEILNGLPNLPFDDVPIGKNEDDNVVIREVGKKPEFDFKPKEHWEIGEELDIIDISRAAKVSGSRFSYLKGDLALLEIALIQFVFSVLGNEKILKGIIKSANLDVVSTPFIPIIPPVLIKPDVLQKMARLEPKEERYHTDEDDMYLVGSAEHTLGSMHMDEIFKEDQLPLRYVGFSTSFRREAGSYGKDVKGILRVHQFDKVEMESFTIPEDSRKEQDFIVAIQEYLMKALEIPYRVINICTGDMGGPDARQIDIEAWMPGQDRYRETHTSDLNTDYQSRRLNIKVKRDNGETEFVHMNDATAFAIGRTIIAIIENYQTKNGTVKIPKVLQKYMGIKEIK